MQGNYIHLTFPCVKNINLYSSITIPGPSQLPFFTQNAEEIEIERETEALFKNLTRAFQP